jgi:hypothetical protein
MPPRRPTDTENRLLLLYAIEQLGAVTAQQLLVFMVENNLMDYISVQLGLAGLEEARLLRRQKHALGALYALTGAGRDTITLFVHRVPHSRIQRIDGIAVAWRARFRREKQMVSVFARKADGEYEVRLRLLERETDLLDLRLSVPTRAQAQGFCDTWEARAAEIYGFVMRSLGEGEAKEK